MMDLIQLDGATEEEKAKYDMVKVWIGELGLSPPDNMREHREEALR